MQDLKKDGFWTPLDNAAKIFPAIRSNEHTTVIRLSVIFKDRIAIGALQKAVARAEKRFPYYLVSLRRGFFWYYLEQSKDQVSIYPDNSVPCRKFDPKAGEKLLIRMLAVKNKLSVEVSHILTDGHGTLNFLRSVILYYFNEKGVIGDKVISQYLPEKIDNEELEDAYSRYFKDNIPRAIKQPKAFHLPFPLAGRPRFNVLYAQLSIEQLKEKAREKEVSITDYLVSIYLLVLQEIFEETKEKGMHVKDKIARIQVPVNLRNIYPTKTMRNFSLFVMPEIDFRLGRYSFDEILKIVYHRMQLETDEKLISKIISRNVGGEKKLLVRGIPIWLKSLVLYLKYYSEGANQYSGVVTNLGMIKLPDEIADKVEYFALTPPPPNNKLKINCGVIGYDKKLIMSFGNITKSRDFERKFLKFLSNQGLEIKITKS